ncbi:MAG: glycosyltransferase family 4 protein [Prevotella sp.]|nr:glycosyltransferase family 4 protein [Candidatus Prevotella equi]
MLRILMNSYTCCPGMGSEQGMGWNWITSLAKTGEVELFVISEGEYRSQIEKSLSLTLPHREGTAGVNNAGNSECWKERIHFYWNPVPQSTRDKCWNQGNWSFYPLYEKWQKKTAEIAREIIKELEARGERIDILHQLNMIGFREPGYLWQVSKETGIPFVWGPVDAKDKFPLAYTEGASLKTKAFLWLKNAISVWQLKYSRRVTEAAGQASVLLGASSNSVKSFRHYMGIDAILMNETGCNLASLEVKNEKRKVKSDNSPLEILWVGKMDFRKQLGLALEAVAHTNIDNVKLHIVGGGENASYKNQTEKLGISDMVVWHGAVSHDEVQQLMRECNLLLFTSVAEGTPHVVLEAMANGLPVVCHDTCGHGDSVTDECGVKIPVINPTESVKRFSEIIVDLYNDREKLATMSDNCAQRAEELSWENKAKKMVELYKGCNV